MTSTTVDEPESGSSEPPATRSTTTLTTTIPRIHPKAKAGPFDRALGVPSIRITATIGSGLSATPTTDGQEVPDRLAH